MDKLKKIVENNPFLKDPGKPETFMHVTFLSSKPDPVDLNTITGRKQTGEEIVIDEDVVYLYCPKGYGSTKLSNNFLENKLKVGATTRNWRTTTEILKSSQNAEE